MKLKRIALAAALLAASVPALAVTTELGVLDNDIDSIGGGFPVGASFFSDTFTFQLLSSQTVSGFYNSAGIGSLLLQLLNSNFVVIGTDATPGPFSFGTLPAGSYALNFVGFNAAPGAVYGGTVTAVPEPESYALMLAGLGAVGFIATRRRERA